MSDNILTVGNVSKRYLINAGRRRTTADGLRHAVGQSLKAFAKRSVDTMRGQRLIHRDNPVEFWALRNVSFEVKRGEVLGIIGRNGAGKSTLLKILSRITEPTEGRIRIRGRVASLLEVGTGFHPELTGRENVFLNGALLGMTRREVAAQFDQIIDFAGVDGFLDTPVKRYSSGMYVRLAFAVAAHLKPEILIVDEVLAVGDAEFQRKCLGKMNQVARNEGRTVLFVSHNLPAVQQLCTSAITLAEGRIGFSGSVNDAIRFYMSTLEKASSRDLLSRRDRDGDGRLRVTNVTLHDQLGTQIESATCGEALRVRLHYRSQFAASSRLVDAAFTVRNEAGALLTCFANVQTGAVNLRLYPEGYLECTWPKVNLRAGVYISTVFVGIDGTASDWIQDAFQLTVQDGNYFGTGNLVPRDHGDVVFDQAWTSVAAETIQPAQRVM